MANTHKRQFKKKIEGFSLVGGVSNPDFLCYSLKSGLETPPTTGKGRLWGIMANTTREMPKWRSYR